MKKNWFMRIGCMALVLAMSSTYAISGTFAKYVSEVEGSDMARVAKWGIQITSQHTSGNSVFSTSYPNNSAVVTVNSSQKVVAPGTESAAAHTFSISGTSEVSIRLDIVMDNVKDVCLPKGEYYDYTVITGTDNYGKPQYTRKFTLDKPYYPIIFTLKQIKTNGVSTDTIVSTGSLTTIQLSREVPAGTSLDEEYQLTWEWPIDGNPQADTLICGGHNANATTLQYNISITATQVD